MAAGDWKVMILSRVWYVLLGLAVAVALYVVFIAVGQYERQTTRALKEGLASDSQTVDWALKIDNRRRLDALLAGSVDATLQQALVQSNSSKDGKIPDKAKADAKKALSTIHDAIPTDWRNDALFAVDRDGRVVGALGFDQVAGNDDFEMGGYPAVNDALHGWLRDDVWMLGSKMYVVVARPVEYDVTQRPAGAIVGLKEVNKKLADDLSKRTRTNIAFYASGQRVAAGVGTEGFDDEKLDAVGADLQKVDDKTYGDGNRSEVRMLTDDLGVMYARLPGDVWSLGGGFAVARSKTILAGPMGFLSNADDRDKATVPWPLLAGVVLLAMFIGIGFTLLEHTMPLRELVMQAERLKAGGMDGLQVARFRGSYRLAAQSINQGMERSIEKAGGVSRKPADLESILGPSPAQPSMSAFSFPMADGAAQPATPHVPAHVPAAAPRPPPQQPQPPPPNAPTFSSGGTVVGPPPMVPPRPPPQRRPPARPRFLLRPPRALHSSPTLTAPWRCLPRLVHPSPRRLISGGTPVNHPALPPPPPAPPMLAAEEGEDEDATMVGAVPADVMAQATGENRALEDTGEWVSVYDDFIRTKKQCGEATEGLTFEKFSHTLKKNRDALISAPRLQAREVQRLRERGTRSTSRLRPSRIDRRGRPGEGPLLLARGAMWFSRRPMRRLLCTFAGVFLALSVGGATRMARASSVEEFPDNGSEQEGRGGAWIARASDPLAAFYNPAGLAGQPTRLTLQANLSTQNTCFTRVKAANDTTQDGVTAGGSYPKVCNDGAFFPDPQLGFTWHVSNRVGLGLLVLGPSAVGNVTWPEFVNGSTPAPNRYMLLKTNVVFLTPTIAVGWEAVDRLRLGASFQAGIAPSIGFANAAPALNADNTNPSNSDIRAELTAKDLFVPGFTLGALWSPNDEVDVAGWYKYSAPISAKGDIETAANYFTPQVATGNTSKVIYGDTALPNCNDPHLSNQCGNGNNASINVPIPMEAKLGVRYHKRRAAAYDPSTSATRWRRTSSTSRPTSPGRTTARSTTSSSASPGDVPAATVPFPPTPAFRGPRCRQTPTCATTSKIVFGVHLGGDFNVLPDQLAIRAGALIFPTGDEGGARPPVPGTSTSTPPSASA